jgi:hypothetical protein
VQKKGVKYFYSLGKCPECEFGCGANGRFSACDLRASRPSFCATGIDRFGDLFLGISWGFNPTNSPLRRVYSPPYCFDFIDLFGKV